MRIRFLVLAALAASAWSEAAAQSAPTDVSRIRAAIEAADARWSAQLAAGHADSVAMMYASNGRMMGEGMPTAVGRDAIRQAYSQMLKMGTWNIRLHTDTVWANGPLVLERGTWTSSFKPAAGSPPMDSVETGKYMVRWTQENGRWVFTDDIFNSDKMPSPPPAAAQQGKSSQ